MALQVRRLSFAALFFLAFAGGPAPAQAQPTELFFSEYVEGTSNNKALEIFNGTSAAVNLGTAGYNVQMFFNGSGSAGLTINLTGSVASGDVYVVAQSLAAAEILAQADQTNGSGWFNGDDAVVLRKGTTVIDVIGQIGFDPGTEWGSGLTSTADNTIRRKDTIGCGDANGADVFDPVPQWDGFATNTFGGLGVHSTTSTGCEPPPPPVALLAEIAEIQGPGLASPVVGLTRRTEGNVVTAVLSTGFFIQDPTPDGDPETSEGLFVFTNSAPTVSVGQEVKVVGTVVEFFNMTEMNPTAITVTGSGSVPTPVTFDEQTPSPLQPQPATEMERYEGMLVRVINGTVSSPTNQFGEASVVAGPERAFRETGIIHPGLPGLPVWDGNPEIFEIDTDEYAPDPGLHLPAGATFSAQGPLFFSFGDYQILPTELTVSGEAAVRPVRARAAGEFTVGSQNFLRLFDLIDDPNRLPSNEPVPTAAEYAIRLNKLSLHVRLAMGAPDIVAVQEVETLQALQDAAAKIQADDPAIAYTAYLEEGNDIGGIDVGFLVRNTIQVDTLTQVGKDDVFEFPGNPPAPLNDRPPLLLRGSFVGNGASFPLAVLVVHQRSLSGVDGSDGPRIRAKRHAQAVRLAEFVQSMQSAEPGLRLVVIGDFNAFEFTDGYVDVMGQVTGLPDPGSALLPVEPSALPSPALTNQTLNMPAGERYSFVFDGTAQSLDHAITTQPFDPWLRGAEHPRGNADAPFAFEDDPTTSLRSSDHDGTVVFIMSDADADGVPDDRDNCARTANPDQADADHDGVGDVCDNCGLSNNSDQADEDSDGLGDVCDVCLGTQIPEGVPATRLGVNHFALVDGDGRFDTTSPEGTGPEAAFTIQDTGGCSCAQIVDALGLGLGHSKFGCSLGVMRGWVAAVP
jgi:predicted extracellular nuclease